jgi:hypothetical protein
VLVILKLIRLKTEIWMLYAYVICMHLILFFVGASLWILTCITGYFGLTRILESIYIWLSEGNWVGHDSWEILEHFNLVGDRGYLFSNWIGISKIADSVLSTHPIGITFFLAVSTYIYSLWLELLSYDGELPALKVRRDKVATLKTPSQVQEQVNQKHQSHPMGPP